ncbi:MAG: hypothetical protein EHJ95_01960 [Methanobacteriota archaeon]|nr:MAG: hypothetical protein EHJ95_01960 [Euryarchaeota archaeon]
MTTAAPTQTQGPSLSPGPTVTMPPNQRIEVMVDDKDPIYARINVEFRGGSGQSAVTNIALKLTRADGVVVQETLPARVGQTIQLQGTRGATDRLEVTVSLNNGQSYKIIDKLMYAQTRP